MHSFLIYFLNKTLHFSDSSSVHHQEFMVYVIEVCWQLAVCVQWKTPDDGQRNCPKNVEFYSKNKFEKWVHLVGIIIRICLTHLLLYKVYMCRR